jgi:ABC-2 type transport system permease protein
LKKPEKLINPHNSIIGNIDPAGALLFLLPLLIIAFNFNIISAEREAGRLPILAAQGLLTRQWIWYKVGFRFLAITSLTVLTLLLNHWFFSEAREGSGKAMAGFMLAIALYSAFWHTLSAAINLYKKTSDFNAGLLFAIWIAQVMVIPGLATVIGTVVRPTEGKVKLIDEVRQTLTTFDRKNSQLLDQFYTDHPRFAAKDSANVMPVFVYKYIIKYMHTLDSLTPVMNDYKRDAWRQAHAVTRISVISPSMIFQELADELAGNSQTQFLQFQLQADSMVRNWNDFINPKALGNQPLGREVLSGMTEPVFLTKISAEKVWWLTGSMAGWLGLLLGLAYRQAKKFTVI